VGGGRYIQFLVHFYSGFSLPDQKRKADQGIDNVQRRSTVSPDSAVFAGWGAG
jgi:hypothetical protein